jgi:hypothetical protein
MIDHAHRCTTHFVPPICVLAPVLLQLQRLNEEVPHLDSMPRMPASPPANPKHLAWAGGARVCE